VRTIWTAAVTLSAAALLTISCGGIVDPSKNQMETFSGTVKAQGFDTHTFTVNNTGEISIKITAMAPLDNIPLGVIWGQASSAGTCVSTIQSAVANLNIPAISSQIYSGAYCVVVYDLGILSADETYSVLVSHP
jgi:hypothetical protein